MLDELKVINVNIRTTSCQTSTLEIFYENNYFDKKAPS